MLQVYARYSIHDPASQDGAPAREKSGYFGAAMCLEGTPLASARCIPTSQVGVTTDVNLCLPMAVVQLCVCMYTYVAYTADHSKCKLCASVCLCIRPSCGDWCLVLVPDGLSMPSYFEHTCNNSVVCSCRLCRLSCSAVQQACLFARPPKSGSAGCATGGTCMSLPADCLLVCTVVAALG